MNKDNIIKLTLIFFVTMLILTILGVTYAYFTLDIEGTPKDIVMSSGDLRLEYKDGTELKLDGAFPGETITKVITVTNIGTMNASYSLYLGNLINTIEKNELSISLDCKSYTNYNETTKAESSTCNGGKKVIPVSATASSMTIKDGISIEPNITQEYTVTITFKETKKEQNYNKNKKFSGQIGIGESTLPEPVYCTFDGELTQGMEYVNGQYTYRYMQEYGIDPTTEKLAWLNISNDGWGVTLTNKESTDPVTSEVCTYINNKPVTSMSMMFGLSQATSIDLSNLNTSNVTNIGYMFFNSQTTTIDVSNFDTSKVTNMSSIFYMSQATTIDVSNFDTSKVTDMSGMFQESQATIIKGLENLDTGNVTDISWIFGRSKITSIDLSSFDTSKVTDMSQMFYGSQATVIKGLENFDTSNVTDMSWMFSDSQATSIDLSDFNTSKVTDMSSMFYGSQATVIKGLENFDTSNVIDMKWMFSDSHATSIDLSDFNTSKVTDMSYMFYGCESTSIDISNFNTSNVTNMTYMFRYLPNLTTIDLSSFDTSNVTSMRYMFYKCANLKTIYASDKFVTTNVTDKDSMFTDSTKLVGGSGTVYDSTKVDTTYARIDGGTELPGYFTSK
mgnify:FL=1